MTAPFWQHIVVALIALGAVAYLVRRYIRAKSAGPGCAECVARARAAKGAKPGSAPSR